jgi:hypothetical protein
LSAQGYEHDWLSLTRTLHRQLHLNCWLKALEGSLALESSDGLTLGPVDEAVKCSAVETVRADSALIVLRQIVVALNELVHLQLEGG